MGEKVLTGENGQAAAPGPPNSLRHIQNSAGLNPGVTGHALARGLSAWTFTSPTTTTSPPEIARPSLVCYCVSRSKGHAAANSVRRFDGEISFWCKGLLMAAGSGNRSQGNRQPQGT